MSSAERRGGGAAERLVAERPAVEGAVAEMPVAERPASDKLILIAGLGVVGVSGYAFLAMANRSLGAVPAAAVSVLWTVSNSLGAGLFVPVEQELARRSSTARALGAGLRSLVARSAQLAGLLVAVIALICAGLHRPLAARLFDGQGAVLACLVVVTLGFAAQHVTRGVLAGSGRFDRYGRQLAVDGGLRLAGAVLIAAAGVRSVLAFALVLAAAPLVSVAVTAPGVAELVRPGPRAPWREVMPDFGLVGLGQVFSVTIIGAGPVAAVLLAGPHGALGADILVGVLLVARAPLLAFYAVQATLLPGLARLAAQHRWVELRRRIARSLAGVLALAVLATAGAAVAGPWVVRRILGPQFVASPQLVTTVVAATMLYIVAAVTAQALLAFGGHRWFAATWFAGLVVYLVGLLDPLPPAARVSSAFLLSATTAFLVAAGALARVSRRAGRSAAGGPEPERAAEQGGENRRGANLHVDQLG